jgi:hypothetical protein
VIGFLDKLEKQLMLPGRDPNEEDTQKMLNDAIDRFVMGSVKARAVERVVDPIATKAVNWLTGSQDLSQEKTKLEIELMKRQLSKYSNDDSYEKALNAENSPVNPLLVAGNLQRYAGRGKSLVEAIIGDIDNAGLIQRLVRRR